MIWRPTSSHRASTRPRAGRRPRIPRRTRPKAASIITMTCSPPGPCGATTTKSPLTDRSAVRLEGPEILERRLVEPIGQAQDAHAALAGCVIPGARSAADRHPTEIGFVVSGGRRHRWPPVIVEYHDSAGPDDSAQEI